MKKLMRSKTSVWCMVMILLFTAVFSMTSAKLEAFAQQGLELPNIITSIIENNELHAGETQQLKIKVENSNPLSFARSVSFIPQNGSPFVFVEPVTEMPIQLLTSDTPVILELSVEVDKYAVNGVHPLTFNLEYIDPWNNRQSSEQTVQVKVTNNKTNCKLVLHAEEGISATAGGNFDLPLSIKNIGDLSAKDVRINITGQDNFTLISGTGRVDYDRILGKETKNHKYSLKAPSSLKSGSYSVTFNLVYTDEQGKPISEDQTIWIPVAGIGSTGTVLQITEIKPTKTTIKPGETFDVIVNVKNSGAFDSGQVKISADGGSLLPVSQNLQIIQSLKKGESKSISFSFQPQPQASRGSVPITINVEPVDGQDGTSISQAISVFVDSDSTGEPEPGKNIPKIIIKSYSSEPTLVNAGENFNLTMQFLNTHSSREVRNIKGSFSVTESSSETGNVFTPVGSSNTFYIDKITPQSTADWNVTLFTIPDAKSKTYTLSIFFEYEDDLGTQHSATEIIGIPVYQPSRFEVSEIMVPSETYMGQPIYVGFEMYNLGKTDIYNVKLNVEGDFEAQPKSNYFGNFESGRVEYFEFNLMPMMVGQANGQIIFQYENASGEVQQTIKEISMNVMEMFMPPDGDFPVDGFPMEPGMEEPSKGFFNSIWFYIILGVVVVAGVVTTVILIKRKKRKNKEFEF